MKNSILINVRLGLMILCISSLLCCQTSPNTNDLSIAPTIEIDPILEKEKYNLNFESQTENSFIKIGNFLNPQKHNAIVINFDNSTDFKVFELNNDQWKLIFHQKNTDLTRVADIKAFIADYNFDNLPDIGIRSEISNGTAIMTFNLWLNYNKGFIEIPEFRKIGNPTIIKNKKTIQGYNACCAFSEMSLTNYTWDHLKLNKLGELTISNYPLGAGINSQIINQNGMVQSEVDIDKKQIDRITKIFNVNWELIDTIGKIGCASNGIAFYY